MRMKRIAILALAATLAVGTVFAQKTELNFWTWRPEDTEKYQTLLASFEKQNPGITVKISAFKNTEYNTILSAAEARNALTHRTYAELEREAPVCSRSMARL